jgi:hypothetical protein
MPMAEPSTRPKRKHAKRESGFLAVLETLSVTTTTVLFLPGLLVRIGCQQLAARLSGFELEYTGFSRELGGEIEGVPGDNGWTPLLVATVLGPVTLGVVLLLPRLIGSALLGVSVFPAANPSTRLVLTHSTSLVPFIDTLTRLGGVEMLRLWFGVSCFYCCVPSIPILEGAGKELHARPAWSPLRWVGTSTVAIFRALRAVDFLLTFFLPGAYLASGVIILFVFWDGLTMLIKVVL